jgi:hypothetical protein
MPRSTMPLSVGPSAAGPILGSGPAVADQPSGEPLDFAVQWHVESNARIVPLDLIASRMDAAMSAESLSKSMSLAFPGV